MNDPSPKDKFTNPYLSLENNVRTTMLIGRRDHSFIKTLIGNHGAVQTVTNILLSKLCHELERIFPRGSYGPDDAERLITGLTITFPLGPINSPDATVAGIAREGFILKQHGPGNPGTNPPSNGVRGSAPNPQPDDKTLQPDVLRGDAVVAQPTPGNAQPDDVESTHIGTQGKGVQRRKRTPGVKG